MQLTIEDVELKEFVRKNPQVVNMKIETFLMGLRAKYEKGKIELEDYAIALRKCRDLK